MPSMVAVGRRCGVRLEGGQSRVGRRGSRRPGGRRRRARALAGDARLAQRRPCRFELSGERGRGLGDEPVALLERAGLVCAPRSARSACARSGSAVAGGIVGGSAAVARRRVAAAAWRRRRGPRPRHPSTRSRRSGGELGHERAGVAHRRAGRPGAGVAALDLIAAETLRRTHAACSRAGARDDRERLRRRARGSGCSVRSTSARERAGSDEIARYSSKASSRTCCAVRRARRSEGGASPPYSAPESPTSRSSSSIASSSATRRDACAGALGLGRRTRARGAPGAPQTPTRARRPRSRSRRRPPGRDEPAQDGGGQVSGIAHPASRRRSRELVDGVDGGLRAVGLVRPAEAPAHEDHRHAVRRAALDVVVPVADQHRAAGVDAGRRRGGAAPRRRCRPSR